MDVADFLANSIDQDRGRTLVIVDPWTGEPVDLSFVVAGPDSDVQRRARIAMMDELAEMARPDGTVSAENREIARIACLARCVIGWGVTENGREVPFEHRHVVRVLGASKAIQEQVDAFAGDRSKFGPASPFEFKNLRVSMKVADVGAHAPIGMQRGYYGEPDTGAEAWTGESEGGKG